MGPFIKSFLGGRGCFVLLLYFSVSFAETTSRVIIDENVDKISLGKHLEILHDRDGEFTIGDVIAPERAKDFVSSCKAIPNYGFTESVYWVRFSLMNSLNREQLVLLEEAYPHIDDIQVFIFRNGKQVDFAHGGDRFSMWNNTIVYNHFIKKIKLPADSETMIFCRFETESSMQLPLFVWKPLAFAEKVDKEKLILGVYFGVMLAMFLYNFFVLLFLKDINYLFYIFYIGTFIITQLGVTRLDMLYLWPSFPEFANLSHAVFFNLTFFFGGLFCKNFLNTKKEVIYFDRAITLVMGVCLIGVILTLISGYTAGIKCVVYCGAVLGPVIMLGAGIVSWLKKGRAIAKYYTLAWSVFLVTAVIFNLRNMGVLPSIPIIDYSPHIGSSLEVFLLSIALSDRINHIRNETIKAKNRAYEAERKFTSELKNKVRERTELLEKANKKLKKLSNTDGLTGMFNRRYFNRQLTDLWKHHQREQLSISIIICDIDFFKSYNDTYGHLSGDECIKSVARVISKHATRPLDFAARYGGEEFVIVLPETNSKGALSVAQRVGKAVLDLRITNPGSSVNSFLTLSLGVAAMVPDSQTEASVLLSMADDALYQSKKDGRNRISLKTEENG